MLKAVTKYVLLAVIFPLILPSAHADTVLIVKKSFPLNSISKTEISDLWLAKTKSVGILRPIFVIDLMESNPLRIDFYKNMVGLQGRELEIYWDKKLFSGRVVKPKTVETDRDVIQMVTEISGVMGYVDRESVSGEVKVLQISD